MPLFNFDNFKYLLIIFCLLFKVRFYDGVVELSLYAALKRDPQGMALHFYRNGEPHGDMQGREAFIARYFIPVYLCNV